MITQAGSKNKEDGRVITVWLEVLGVWLNEQRVCVSVSQEHIAAVATLKLTVVYVFCGWLRKQALN